MNIAEEMDETIQNITKEVETLLRYVKQLETENRKLKKQLLSKMTPEPDLNEHVGPRTKFKRFMEDR